MPKDFFQDMVRIKRENREKLKQQDRTPVSESVPAESPAPVLSPENKFASVYDLTDKKNAEMRPRRMLWLVAVISVVVLFFALSFLFAKATITVNPKTQEAVLNQNFSAVKGNSADSLSFDLVVISGEENKVVPATLEKEVSRSAEGVAIIYNNFSSKPQNLDIDTRLEGSNGKIYKTKTKTTVPGMGGSAPGSIEVRIYASEAGPEYNSVPLDFKIFGFKGTPKYSGFYARSKGAITGGLEGRFPFIPDAEKEKALDEMAASLESKLLQKATDQIPDGFILFKDAIVLNIQEQSNLSSPETGTLPLKLEGTLYGILFNESNLTKKIAENNVAESDGSEVFISNIKELKFSSPLVQANSSNNISLQDVKNISFELSGTAKIVWRVDEGKLTGDLLGKSKKNFSQVLLQYPNIDSALLVINPLWKRSIPEKREDIKIIVNYPK